MTDLRHGAAVDALADVDGLVNGRWVTVPGLARRRLARSGCVAWVTPAGAERLVARHGITAVLDLRSDSEVERYGEPSAMTEAGITWVRAPLTGYPSDPINAARPEPAAFVDYFHGMLEHSAASWPTIVRSAAHLSAAPFLVGCHCGKDRTGVVVAVLASLAGVSPSPIAHDYGESADPLIARLDRFEDKWVKRGHTRDDWLVRVGTEATTMQQWLAEVERRHDGVAKALLQAGARDDDLRLVGERLRAEELA